MTIARAKADIPARIINISAPAPDIRIVRAQPLEPYNYKAGQYTYIQIDDDETQTRPFSIAQAPNDDNTIEFHIRYSGFSVSEWMFKKAQIGSLFSISAALGECTYASHTNKTRPILAISGGVGISQIKAILEQLINDQSDREIILYEGVKRIHDLYLIKHWESLENQLNKFKFRPVFSEEHTPEEEFMRTGMVGQQVCLEINNLDDYDIYIAGPPAMINDTHERLIANGANPKRIFKD